MPETEKVLASKVKRWQMGCGFILLLLVILLTSPLWGNAVRKVTSAPGSMAERKACGKNLETIAQALDRYKSENSGQYPAPEDGLKSLAPQYIDSLPLCAEREDTYRVLYGEWADNPDNLEDYFLIWCKGHGRKGFPRYDHQNKVIESIYDFKVSPRARK